MSDWISVKENPPKPGRYLVFEKKEKHAHNCMAWDYPYPCCEPNIAYFSYSDGWKWHSGDKEACNPTHYMNISEPPNE